MSPRPGAWLVVVLMSAFFGVSPSEGASVEIGPEADLCAEINALAPGDELVLRPGEYRGPVVVRNNVSVASHTGGIGLEDYGRRGLLRGIVVAHNTVFGNQAGGIVTPEGGVRDALLVNNAAHARVGAPALPPVLNGVELAGNVDCSLLACFMNPEARDFSPLLGAGLVGAGAVRVEPWVPGDDYLGNRRGIPPTVGALERPGGPIPLAPKP